MSRDSASRSSVSAPVAGAFHSPLMAPAEEQFAPVVAALPLRRGEVPVVSSISGEPVENLEEYRSLLTRQITSPVVWDEVVHVLCGHRDLRLVEVGPGRTLRGLVRQFEGAPAVIRCDGHESCLLLAAEARPG